MSVDQNSALRCVTDSSDGTGASVGTSNSGCARRLMAVYGPGLLRHSRPFSEVQRFLDLALNSLSFFTIDYTTCTGTIKASTFLTQRR